MSTAPEEECCAICLEAVDDERRRGVLACGHAFHAGCLEAYARSLAPGGWMRCPVCRAPAVQVRVVEAEEVVVESDLEVEEEGVGLAWAMCVARVLGVGVLLGLWLTSLASHR